MPTRVLYPVKYVTGCYPGATLTPTLLASLICIAGASHRMSIGPDTELIPIIGFLKFYWLFVFTLSGFFVKWSWLWFWLSILCVTLISWLISILYWQTHLTLASVYGSHHLLLHVAVYSRGKYMCILKVMSCNQLLTIFYPEIIFNLWQSFFPGSETAVLPFSEIEIIGYPLSL